MQQTTIYAVLTMEEAPSSPKSAALYYWGGSDDTFNGIMEDNDTKCGFYWEEVKPADEWSCNSRGVWDNNRRRGRRSQLKFTLTMDDDTHWMFLRPYAQISLGECFIETDGPEDREKDDNDSSVLETILSTSKEELVSETLDESTDFESIPIIDLSIPLEGPEGYACKIAEACRSSGFFYIINHGVDPDLMKHVMQRSKCFFDLKMKDKLTCVHRDNEGDRSGYRGYFGIGMEDLENKDGTRDLAKEEGAAAQKIEGDQKEGFDCGLEYISGFHENSLSKEAYVDFFGANSWPDEVSHSSIVGFRETLIEYQKALLKLSDKMMMALAISLSSDKVVVPIDYFVAQSRNPMCTLRLLHYPLTPKIPSLKSNELFHSPTGCGAHTDYGLFTILLQDDIGGLQIRNKSNTWIDARPLPNSFVINVGDMLSRWTEGEYASTVHRVISPTLIDNTDGTDRRERDGEECCLGKHRYSIPFFFNPDHDAMVKPIRSASNSNNISKTAVEILKDRYACTFKSK